MSIETVGTLNKILSNYDSKSWTKSADLEKVTDLDFAALGTGPLQSPDKRKSFSELLADSVLEVNDLQKDADKAIQRLVTGKSKNIHETMLAVEKAELAFKTMNQVRQKVIDAYKEIMRMQI